MGILEAGAVLAGCLVLMLGWIRWAKAAARREFERTYLVDPFVRCTHGGGHVVSRRRAIPDGTTYDGAPLYICHDHRFERRRQLRAGEEKRPAGGAGLGG